MMDIYQYQSTHLEKNDIFDLVVENMEVGYVCLAESENYDFHYVHPTFPTMLGYGLEEFAALSEGGFLSFVLEKDREKFVKAIEEYEQVDSNYKFKCRLCKKNGEHIWVVIMGKRAESEDGSIHLRCMIKDIDIQEKSDREKEKQKLLLDNVYSDQIVGVISTYSRGNEVGVDVINNMVPKLYGYDTMEEFRADIKDFKVGNVHPDDAVLMQTKSMELKKEGDMHEMDLRVRHKDGVWHILHAYTKLIVNTPEERCVQRVIVDVTEERKNRFLQDQLQRAESRYRVFDIVANHTNNAYVLFSEEDLSVSYVSPNLFRMLGIKPESVRTVHDVFGRGYTEEEFRKILPLVTPRESIPCKTKREHRVTHEVRYYTESLYRTKFDDEERILLMISDRTLEKRSQSALEIAVQNAEHANRAKTSFLSDMSHDLRTPMNAIAGLITLLKADINNPKKVQEHVALMEKSSENMLELINNILDMSRIESGATVLESEPFSVEELCEEVVAIHRPQGTLKGIVLTKEFNLIHKTYFGDHLRIKQILSNLASNAVKYTTDRGKVEVKVFSKPMGDSDFELITFVIKDSGIGMSKEFLETIFVPFARERNTTMSGVGGTGLGMPIVKNLVEIMNGHIYVESEQGVGSTFTVEIPLRVVREEVIKKPESAENLDIDLAGVRVLVVEDNAINAEILIELLEMEGIVCDLATDGRKALEKLASEQPDYYDVVLMDVQMPVMNGYEATKAIRMSNHPRGKTIPIIAMTANAFQEDVRNALEAGMDLHIAKPVNMRLLKEAIHKLLHREG